MYSSSHSVLLHLYQYIMLFCFFIFSLSLGNINKVFNVFPPWSMPGLHTCYRWTCSFHIVLWYRVPLCDIFSVLFWCFFLCPSCSSSVLVLLISSVWPTWDTCIVLGPPVDVPILLLAVGSWRTLLWPCVLGCWSHYICKPDCGGYPTVDINQCGWASYILLLSGFHLLEGWPKCPGKAWNHPVSVLLW